MLLSDRAMESLKVSWTSHPCTWPLTSKVKWLVRDYLFTFSFHLFRSQVCAAFSTSAPTYSTQVYYPFLRGTGPGWI
jgi:hypothetical protein